MNAENILNATIGVLTQRGRCFGEYEDGGRFCVMGAMATAAGHEADYWMWLQGAPQDSLSEADLVLIGAARLLAGVVAPPVGDVDVEDLVRLVGQWHDGERGPGDVAPRNSEVFTALRAAAARAAALSLPEQTEVAHV